MPTRKVSKHTLIHCGIGMTRGFKYWHCFKCGEVFDPLPSSAAKRGPGAEETKQVIWFHGTTAENASDIARGGFKEGTWFARHMEDAIEFGGPIVFWVKVSFSKADAHEWQVCCSNSLPTSSISKIVQVSGASELERRKS